MKNSGLTIAQRPIASFVSQMPKRSFTTPTPEVDSDKVTMKWKNKKSVIAQVGKIYRESVKDEKRDKTLIIRGLPWEITKE